MSKISFITFCVEYYAEHIGKTGAEVYELFKKEGVLDLLENDYGYTHNRIVYTAEHELGHAIGLDHDDDEESVMQSSGSYYGIQSVDIEKVNEIYNS